jgi:Bacterial regulatory proteins, lacI family.
MAGVSRTTVSFVLNGRADVKIPDETRRRVIDERDDECIGQKGQVVRLEIAPAKDAVDRTEPVSIAAVMQRIASRPVSSTLRSDSSACRAMNPRPGGRPLPG